MNIGSIKWPERPRDAVDLYLGFLIKVVEALSIKFSDSRPDPIFVAKQYMAGILPDEVYRSSANIWWDYLDGSNLIRDLQGREALEARLAICLLSMTQDDVADLGEHLSWFFEILGRLGVDMREPIDMMASHFSHG